MCVSQYMICGEVRRQMEQVSNDELCGVVEK